MEHDIARIIKVDPNYQKLVRERSRFSWILTACMMVVYYGYILLVAFDKELMAIRIGNGVMTLAIPVGLAVILFTVIITGIYVWRANSEFDQLTAAIRARVPS
jgi:uncharacterized membrane protein (DUF485 family)